MTNIIIILVLAAIIGCAAWYVYKSKKSGAKCIGCPYSKECGGKNCTQKNGC